MKFRKLAIILVSVCRLWGYSYAQSQSNASASGGGSGTIGINLGSIPQITTATLPPGVVAGQYSAMLTESGGLGPFKYTVDSGALPGGYTLDQATGTISGVAGTAGTYNF